MNNKAQEVHPFAFVGALLGGIFALYMSGTMGAGIGMKITVFAVTAIVCFFVTNLIINKD